VFDLGCAQHQLMIYHVDQRTKAVAGCGRRLVYVESCQRIRGSFACTWVLDTPTFQQARWPDWQRQSGPPGHAFGAPSSGNPSRPVATQLFDPSQPPRPVMPAPAVRPRATDASPASSSHTATTPARGAARRAHPTDLFDPAADSDTSPAGREIPTNLFEPNEL
jgi:hypothetical protein